MSDQKREYEFKAEIKKLLDILSKSLYQHKEIFMRELISNAVDALQKIHFISLTNKDIENPDIDLKISIKADPESNLLTISDAGVGMTKDDLINNLGTIAGSGTEKFVKKLKETQEEDKEKTLDLDIIGQFGVGFYSVFMVADKVEVVSKSHIKGEESVKWESDGSGDFTIEPFNKAERGTDIIIHLKEEEEEFLEQYRIENIIKKYSNFVPFPIYLEVIEEEVEEEEEEKDDKKVVDVEDSEDGEEVVEEEEEDEEPKPINETTPLWKKNKEEITDEQYKEFYQYISKRWDDYKHVINYTVEGKVKFNSILYIPSSGSKDLMDPEVEYGLALYSKNVMIMETCKDLIPRWLRFMKGVLESEDIPLNISRETIQSDRRIMKMNGLLVKKIIRELDLISRKEKDKYIEFWNEFGAFIKEGIVTDRSKSDQLLKLIRFKTSKTEKNELIGMEAYIKRMPEEQEEIYYLVGESVDTMKLSPHLGYYEKSGYEVILFDKPIDNFLMMNIPSYKTKVKVEDKKEEKDFFFKPIDTTEEEKKESEDEKKEGEEESKEEAKKEDDIPEETKQFLEKVKEILANKIIDAKITNKLYGNACRLANPASGMSSSQQRAMRYWTQTQMGEEFQIPRKIFEFNPEHPLVSDLIKLNKENENSGKIKPTILQLFENCLLAEGDLPDPTKMVPRINQILEMLITGNEEVKNVLEEKMEQEVQEEPKVEDAESEKENAEKEEE